MVTTDSVNAALKQVIDPNTGRDLVSSRCVKNIHIEGDDVSLDVELGYPAKSQIAPIRQLVIQALKAAGVAGNVSANVVQKIVAHTVQRGVKVLPNVKNIIAVASGKGGVGKSTTAANLALALAAEGAKVGVLDADIYGPSQPTMFGIEGQPSSSDGKTMDPLANYGVQVNSIGFLVDASQALVWRGPIVVQALSQLIEQTAWGDLDYLVIDLPPGTGDIQLTLSQKVPVTGAVIVTTPQDIALIDARRAISMFEKVGVPVLGIVENMAVHVCSQCGHAEHIFGEGGGASMAEQFKVDLLGSLPLAMHIRVEADEGRPTVVAQPDSQAARIYKDVARKVAIKVAERARDMSLKMPAIVVQQT
jgi:ATP-binding protein involved in chromosome partitioning